MKRKHCPVNYLAAVLLLMIICNACSSSQPVELQYKDGFPDNTNLFTYSGTKLKITDIKNQYKLVFYLTSTNQDCIRRLADIDKIMKIYNYEDISYIILWEDTVPVDSIKKYGIDLNINYTLNNKSSLSKSKPAGFLLNKNNEVMMVTGYSYIDVIKYIISLENKPDMVEKVNDAIFNDAFGRNEKDLDKNRPALLMFLTSNCKLCKETEAIIKTNLPILQEKTNIVTIRPDFDSSQEYDVNYITDYSLVYYNVYDKLYSAKKFPFFIVLDKNRQVQKCFYNADEMINYIKSIN